MSVTPTPALLEPTRWKPIPGCPGRQVMRGGPSELGPAQLTGAGRHGRSYRLAGVRDPLVVTPLPDGGLISYHQPDGRWVHTLGDAAGFSRKLAQLGLDERRIRAEVAREHGDLPEARRQAEAATRADAPGARALLASIAHLEGAMDEAAAGYRWALARCPEDAVAHAGLAVLLAQRGQATTARAHALAALAGDGLGTGPWLRTLRLSRSLASAQPPRGPDRCAVPGDSPTVHAQRPTLPPPGVVSWSLPELAEALDQGARVVALTGAGISSASGLETRKELWRRFSREDAVSALRFHEEPRVLWEVIRAFWGDEAHPPNAAHRALASLPGLVAILTQNVDGLHQEAAREAGLDTPLVELHGSLLRTACVACGRPDESSAPVLARRDPLPPRCRACGGVLRPDVVLFGEQVPASAWEQAQLWANQAEILLVIGCAMDVSPASELPALAAASGARVVELKRRPSGLGSLVPVHHVAGTAESLLPALRSALLRSGGP